MKKVAGEAKYKAYENCYTRLDSRDKEKNIYKSTKMKKRKIRDFIQIKCIKSENSRILVKDDEIEKK